ncbi:hypothetical protein B0H34DRAFT_680056 [Crassisporium funariophilum]|nr:hypothetical protein B0H34DRAFT_680056 [Crassisporium funariophilum]
MRFSSSLCVALLAIVPVFSVAQGSFMRRDVADIGDALDARGLYFNTRDIDMFLGYLERRAPPLRKVKGSSNLHAEHGHTDDPIHRTSHPAPDHPRNQLPSHNDKLAEADFAFKNHKKTTDASKPISASEKAAIAAKLAAAKVKEVVKHKKRAL